MSGSSFLNLGLIGLSTPITGNWLSFFVSHTMEEHMLHALDCQLCQQEEDGGEINGIFLNSISSRHV